MSALDALAARFAAVYTGAITDVLDRHGYRRQTLPPSLRRFAPACASPAQRSEEFPVFCRYSTPQDCVGRWEVVATDVPITIGGVRVEPGDYVVADADGVVVLPPAVRDAVLAEAERW